LVLSPWWLDGATRSPAGLELASASGGEPRLDLVPLWVRGRVSAPVPRPLCARLDVAAWSLEIRPPDPELVGHMGATD